MAGNEIKIAIYATDKTSPGFNSASKGAKTLEGHITGLTSTFSRWTKAAIGFGTAYYAAQGIEDAFRGAIDNAETLEKAHRSLEVVIKRNNGNVKEAIPLIDKWAAAQSKYGVSIAESTQGLARAAAITGSVQDAQQAYTEALVISKATGKSFTSVLLAASKAQSGQTTALARYIGTLPKGITTQQLYNKVLQRYGGQAQANTAASDRLRASVANIELKIGQALLPTINKLSTALTKWLNKSENQKKIMNDVHKAIGAVSTVVKDSLGLWRRFSDLMGGNEKAVKMLLVTYGAYKVAAKGMAIANTLIGTTGVAAWTEIKAAMISTGIGAALLGIGLIAGYVITHWDKVKGWFLTFWKYLKAGTMVLVDTIKAYYMTLALAVIKIMTTMADGILGAMSHIPFIGGKFARAKDAIDGFASHFQTATHQAFSNIRSDWDKNMGNVSTTVHINGGRGPGGGFAPNFSAGGGGGHGGGGHGGSAGSPFGTGSKGAKTAPDGKTINWNQFVGTHAGEDCSLFTQRAYKKLWNVSIPRTSEGQWKGGRAASGNAVGDLLFYNGHNRFKPPGHVAMYIGNGQLIQDNGSGTVQIMPVDALNSLGYMGSRTYLSSGKAGQGGLPAAPGTSSSSGGSHTSQSTRGQRQGLAIDIAASLRAAGHDVLQLAKYHVGSGLQKAIDAIEAKMKQLRARLKHHLTSKELASIRQQYDNLNKLLRQKMKQAEDAIKKAKLADAAKQKAREAAEAMKKELKNMKAEFLFGEFVNDQMKNAMAQFNQSVGKAEYAALTAAQQQLATLQAQTNPFESAMNAEDRAYDLSSAQTELAAAIASGDTSRIAEAQKALDDIQNSQKADDWQTAHDQQVAAQQALVDDLQSKYDEDEQNYEQHLQDLYDALDNALNDPDKGQRSLWTKYFAWLESQFGITVTGPGATGGGTTTGGGGGGGTYSSPGTPFKAMATGGLVRKPTFALIGEAGPEEVIPLSHLGNTGLHVHIHADTVIGSDLSRAGREMAQPIYRELLKLQKRNSGSGFLT